MVKSGAIRSTKDPERPAGNNKGYKWQNIIKPIWDKCEKKPKEEAKQNAKKSETSTEKNKGVFLPSDPNALCERLELLMASKQARTTGLRNEIVSICDELLRQKIVS